MRVLENALQGERHKDCDPSFPRYVDSIRLREKEGERDDENVVNDIEGTWIRHEKEEGSIQQDNLHPQWVPNGLLW